MQSLLYFAVFAFAIASDVRAEVRTFVGRVLDANGKPIAGASVTTFWRSNGSDKRPDGSKFDLSDPIQLREYWSNVGKLAPFTDNVELTDIEGKFRFNPEEHYKLIYIVDSERTRGTIIEIPNSDSLEVYDFGDIHLLPLVTLRWRFESEIKSKSLAWSHVYIELQRELGGSPTANRLISCGTNDGNFEVQLPPGNYFINGYGKTHVSKGEVDLRLVPIRPVELLNTDRIIDLGTLTLHSPKPLIATVEILPRTKSGLLDITSRIGERAPPLQGIEARGIEKHLEIEAMHGRWCLLYFWGLSCAPCLSHGIPKLMQFYDKNEERRSEFEVIGVCVDSSGELESLTQLDETLKNLSEKAWKRQIPFPVLIDDHATTFKSYDVHVMGRMVLIDPYGIIVDGDDQTLQKHLDDTEQNVRPKADLPGSRDR